MAVPIEPSPAGSLPLAFPMTDRSAVARSSRSLLRQQAGASPALMGEHSRYLALSLQVVKIGSAWLCASKCQCSGQRRMGCSKCHEPHAMCTAASGWSADACLWEVVRCLIRHKVPLQRPANTFGKIFRPHALFVDKSTTGDNALHTRNAVGALRVILQHPARQPPRRSRAVDFGHLFALTIRPGLLANSIIVKGLRLITLILSFPPP